MSVAWFSLSWEHVHRQVAFLPALSLSLSDREGTVSIALGVTNTCQQAGGFTNVESVNEDQLCIVRLPSTQGEG